jgi:hypothetical protein
LVERKFLASMSIKIGLANLYALQIPQAGQRSDVAAYEAN